MQTEQFIVFHISFLSEAMAKGISCKALETYRCDGIEEFSLEEKNVDSLLGMRAYSGGDIPLEVISEVESKTLEGLPIFKFYFFEDDFEQRSKSFQEFLNQIDGLTFSMNTEEVIDWNAQWKKHYRPIVVTDRLSVIPEWYKKDQHKEDLNSIYINPGMGFGTGEHETTFLCLKLYDGIANILPAKGTCLDFGCGSGILGIGAIKKSQLYVDFCDIDSRALDNCLNNLKLNFHENSLHGHALISRERFKCAEKYDLVFANILEHVLISEQDLIQNSLKKNAFFIASGLLVHQIDAIKKCYKELQVVDELTKGDWGAILFQKK